MPPGPWTLQLETGALPDGVFGVHVFPKTRERLDRYRKAVESAFTDSEGGIKFVEGQEVVKRILPNQYGEA
jgi:hypothetical protein